MTRMAFTAYAARQFWGDIMSAKGAKFSPLPFAVTSPKPQNYGQRETSRLAYVWLTQNGYEARSGQYRGNRARSGATPPPEIKSTCRQCSSLAIDGMCTLVTSHEVR